MAFGADFTAIDFETASRRADSACQLAAVAVRDGKIADQRMWMIRPEPFYFSPGNIRIHGIRPDRVRAEPQFGQLWDEISAFLADDCLVAHNATFDMNVLMACLARHSCPVPELHFTCTRLIARRTWPGRRRFGLKPLAQWLGIHFRHHDALEDSIACAKILLAAGIDKQSADLPALEKRLRIDRGRAGPWGISHPGRKSSRASTRGGRSTRNPRASIAESRGDYVVGDSRDTASAATPPTETDSQSVDWQRMVIRAEFIQPLRGKRVVFVGKLQSMSREQAETLTRRCGGTPQPTVDDQTNCLIVGQTSPAAPRRADALAADDPGGDKQTSPEKLNSGHDAEMESDAKQRAQSGQPIQIMKEDEFLGLVSATH